ncbi:MAG: hypothetical protein JSV10_05230 [Candidatus Zixiibacteriota bacterium]|nr:MAG: hypothetical protein JSV10_05230 [candidate division Zixibacteria bacterium]
MKGSRLAVIFVVILLLIFVWAFAQTSQKGTPKKEEPTAFQKTCSVCHTLERVRVEMDKMISDMHKKAGVELPESTIKEIEETFTLEPVEEPHKAMFQEKCSSCHALDVVVKAHQTRDEAEMAEIIDKMAKQEKSGISKEETEKIHESMMMLNEIYEPDVEAEKGEKK